MFVLVSFIVSDNWLPWQWHSYSSSFVKNALINVSTYTNSFPACYSNTSTSDVITYPISDLLRKVACVHCSRSFDRSP